MNSNYNQMGSFRRPSLGKSLSNIYYIPPVPPFYVTEYEASYRWPPKAAYDKRESQYCRKSTLTSRPFIRDTRVQNAVDKSSYWSRLIDILSKLIEQDFQVSIITSAKQRIEEGKLLDSSIEDVAAFVRDWIDQSDDRSSDSEVTELCKKLLTVVACIKRC